MNHSFNFCSPPPRLPSLQPAVMPPHQPFSEQNSSSGNLQNQYYTTNQNYCSSTPQTVTSGNQQHQPYSPDQHCSSASSQTYYSQWQEASQPLHYSSTHWHNQSYQTANFYAALPPVHSQSSHFGSGPKSFLPFYGVTGSGTAFHEVTTQQESDLEWIKCWSANKERKVMEKKHSLSITEARTLLAEAVLLCKELGFLVKILNKSTDASENEWTLKVQPAFTLKMKLEMLQKKLLMSSVLNALKEKLKKRQRKRIRQKKKREEKKENWARTDAYREHAHKVIDAQRRSVQEKVLESKRNREMQVEADNILAEVKRKIHETKRAQECTKIIEKLRHIRKENSQKKGLHVSKSSDDSFQSNISKVKDLLEKQMHVYEAEEKALRVMLESEREGKRELENSEKQQVIQNVLTEKETTILEALFGQTDLDHSHPLYFYWKYYTQAECRLDNLLQIRCQWDTFVLEDDEESSHIPIQWVVPSKPSSDLWATVIDYD